MDVAMETLYSQESPDSAGLNSAGFKLARLARTFRGVLITNPAANISIVGYLSRSSMANYDLDANLSRMGDRIKATRDRLTSFGVWEKSIAGYLPLQAAPITEDLIVVTARDTKVDLFPGINPVPSATSRSIRSMMRRRLVESLSIHLLPRSHSHRRVRKSSLGIR
jgi:hypothetical protein